MQRSTLAVVGAVSVAVVGAAAVAAAWFANQPPPPPTIPPNVLIILWDTTRADRMSLYGNSISTTPKMASWAKEKGVVFHNAVSPDMWTVPSHASLFTGLPSSVHGVSNSYRWLDNKNVTLAEYLKQNGYDTYAFSANPNLSTDHINLVQGFDTVDMSWKRKFRKGALMNMRRKLIKSDASTEISPQNPAGMKTSFYNAAPVTRYAFNAWLDERPDPNKPFVAYLSYMEAHKPRIPSMGARKRVAEQSEIALGLATDLTYESQLLYSYGKKSYTPEELEAVRRVYDATLVDLDDATSELLGDLEARGVLENTIVVFTADHGEQLGEHQLFGHRSGLFEQLVHVPLVVSWPKHLEPREIVEPVSNTQVFGTLMELMGLPGPGTAFVKDSLLAESQVPKAVFSETLGYDKIGFSKVSKLFPDMAADDWAHLYRAVRLGQLKLIESVDIEDKTVTDRRLYDLAADPDELHDLSEAQPDKVVELAKLGDDWRAGLALWDPATAETPIEEEPTEAQRAQLEMLGYLEVEDPPKDAKASEGEVALPEQ